MPTLVIRADAHAEIGVGHVMRSIALAEAWGRLGGGVLLLSVLDRDAYHSRAQAAGAEVVPMPAPQGSAGDMAATLHELRRRGGSASGTPWLCLDGYGFSPDFHSNIHSHGFPLLVIDDYCHLPYYDADIILNQNLGSERFSYRARPDTRLLLGPEHALLRDEFISVGLRAESVVLPTARRLLVTFGGADTADLTSRVISALMRPSELELEITVVIGASNRRYENILEKVRVTSSDPERSPSFKLERQPDRMPELMREADMAISAAGSTCWELAYVGTPMMLIAAADNQVAIAEAVATAGVAWNLGWHEVVTESDITDAVRRLAADPDQRTRMRRSGQALVDGLGAARVARAMAGTSVCTSEHGGP